MDVAQARPRTWSPQVIVFSIVLHAVILYYVASAFQLVPPIPLPIDPPTFTTVRINPPPPQVDPEPIKPHVVPRRPITPPIAIPIQPTPLPPQPAVASTSDGGVIALGREMDEQPVTQALPNYPRTAQERDIQGQVVMSITILPDGSVTDVQVVNAAPRGYFEASAVRAVKTWRYRPSNVARTNVIVHMDFVLKDV